MENQKKPLLIRPSMAPKTNPKKIFCSKSLPTMGASTWFLCVNLYVILQSLCKQVPMVPQCKAEQPRVPRVARV